MDLNITGKVAIIGGSSKGLGKACAVALAKEGVNIVLCARRKDLQRTKSEIELLGLRCWLCRLIWLLLRIISGLSMKPFGNLAESIFWSTTPVARSREPFGKLLQMIWMTHTVRC